MSNNTFLYHEALFDDGCYILRQVVTMLYQGGSHRPDIYFQINEKLWQMYTSVFTSDQRRIIESSGTPYNYSIETGAVRFDVSILSHLAEHTCGLLPSDEILVNVLKVKNLGNIASLPVAGEAITSAGLCNKLDSLFGLYITILESLEHHALCYLHLEKEEIRNRIQEKKIKSKSNFNFSGQTFLPKAPPAFYVSSANRNVTMTHDAAPAFYLNSTNQSVTTTREAVPAFYVSSSNRNITTTQQTTSDFYANSASKSRTTAHEETPDFYVTKTHEATPAVYINSTRSTTTAHEITPTSNVNSANRNTNTAGSHSESPSFGRVALGVTSDIGKTACGVTGAIGKTAIGVTGEIGKTALGVTGEIGKTALDITGEIGKTTLGVFGAVAGIFTKSK